MTSTTDTDGHPEVAEISALTEGILPPERSAALRSHLTDCTLCADVHRSLDEIRALLGTLPGPVRMPDDIAGRIDAALAAEALVSAVTATTVTTEAAQTPAGSPGGSATTGSDVSRETSPGRRRPGGRPAASTGPGRGRRHRRLLGAVLAAACTAIAFTGGAVLIHSFTSQGGGTTPSASQTAQIEAFSGVELPVRVHQLLASATPHSGAQATQGNPMHLDMSTVPACVLHGTGRSGEPLASTRGRYDGHDAYLLVLPHPSDPARVDAYVVDAACDTAPSPAPGRLLSHHTYARG